jgi:photosystem II stability/assembly factor-like uncharacterized protein
LIGRSGLWVVNGDGLFISPNAGTSWTRTDPPSGGDPLADFIDVDFMTSTQGWVVAASENLLVDRTSDGGRTWESVPLPSAALGGGYRSAYVSFATALDGWVTVQPWEPQGNTTVVFGSTDGGATWSTVDGNAPVSAVEFLTPGIGWGLNPTSTTLYRTTDGGASWLPADVSAPPGGSLTLPKFFGTDGYLLAMPKSGKAVVEETTDGRAVWQARETPFTAAALATTSGPLSFTAEPLCLGCVEPFAVVSPTEWVYWGGSELWLTVDGGRTWRSIRPESSRRRSNPVEYPRPRCSSLPALTGGSSPPALVVRSSRCSRSCSGLETTARGLRLFACLSTRSRSPQADDPIGPDAPGRHPRRTRVPSLAPQ